ncbi:glycosyltransferase [Vibrio tapetis]|uniref:Glycosyltransferase n=1 Tax=Vibrio tapetis subsp. tapetis TaxID=1671868 RepID=A0A2N8ZGA5_9VIBR|nr:glycosyltransferase [Vibrio tapetis]SON50952.1 Glycosyltransferase [Vibrio tapetis subsp. tapetis]
MNGIENTNIARVSTVPFFVYSQLSTQLKDIHLAGGNVSIITSPAEPYENEILFDAMHSTIEVKIPRKIEVVNDFKALVDLYVAFRARRFDIIHSTTPKAGLLSSIAGFLARTPVRIHTFTGQVWAEKKGWSRKLLKLLDKLMIKLNHHCYADSESQKQFLISEGVCKQDDLTVLGEGSLAGVNLSRFNRDRFPDSTKNELRNLLNISEDAVVLIFVGRITRDKGILELLKAFEMLIADKVNVSLLLVGPIDEELKVDGLDLSTYISSRERVISTGFTDSPEKYLSIADVFCLPSYREGFGTVIIESASMGIPSVASNIYGLSDAVQDGETGVLVEAKNVKSLASALHLLLTDHVLRSEMGVNARNRAIKYFGSDQVNSLVVDEYKKLMGDFGDK